MKKEFLSYDLALELKELGFDEPCFAFYGLSRDDYKTIRLSIFQNLKTDYLPDIHHLDVTCDAPLWQQSFDWFREKFNLLTCVGFQNDYQYSYEIYDIKKKDCVDYKDTIETYEEARLECLKKLIELAKEQNVK